MSPVPRKPTRPVFRPTPQEGAKRMQMLATMQHPLPADTTEAQFGTKLSNVAKWAGWRRTHFRTAINKSGRYSTALEGDSGWPDWTLVHPAHGLVFAELKVGYNKPSPDQSEWLNLLARAGCRVYLWYPRHWLTAIGPILFTGEAAERDHRGTPIDTGRWVWSA